ncbi:universal stress protein [Noviherbaspirillum massiliense]|uniref:universal stress protein n=1 Tax=Noviherbaspirillum massiliense TaxID=1465823 RepID=UPI0002E03A29|nr:universal stress protein [Noviherbaspirillum massiliense]
MAYKTILVHVDESTHAPGRIEVAARLALENEAHLIGAATSGMSRTLYRAAAFSVENPDIESWVQMLHDQAEAALDRFESIARQAGLASFERRLVDDEAVSGISLQARYADLVVLGQEDPDEIAYSTNPGFPGQVIMAAGCPALVIPYAGSFPVIGHKILLAWNASMEARRTVHYALPLLARAQSVNVAVFNPSPGRNDHGEQPGADLALYLARHNIKVNVVQRTTDINVGAALLALADDFDADLIAMGCYGHPRVREVLLGGATRTILQSMSLPVFMAH